MSLLLRSRKRVFEIIELTDTQVSNDTIKEYLNKNKKELLEHLNFYKKAEINEDAESLKTLDSLSSSEKDFIEKASKFMNLQKSQCYKMLEGVLWERVKYPQNGLSQTFKLEFDQQLIDELNYYLFSEQEATLLLWSALLRTAEDPSHPFYNPVYNFIKECFPDSESAAPFVNSLLEQFSLFICKKIPSTVLSSPEHATRWALHYLNLQCHTLNVIFFLYYTHLVCPPAQTVKILKTLSKYHYALSQTNESLFDSECTSSWNDTVRLSILLSLNILNLEQIINSSDIMTTEISQPQFQLKPWIEPDNHLESLVELFKNSMNSSKSPEHVSPIILAVGCLITGFFVEDTHTTAIPDTLIEISEIGPKLVQMSMNLKVFDFLFNFCTTPFLLQPAIQLAYKSVLKGLLMIFVKLYPINAFSGDVAIFHFTAELFRKVPELASQFWEQDFPIEECRDILTTCRLRFPLVFHPFVNLLGSVIGDVNTASYTLRYLSSCPTFCDFLDDSRYLSTMERHVYEFTSSSLLKTSGLNLAVPSATSAKLIAPSVVSLQYRFSVWHYFLCLLDAFVHEAEYSQQVADVEDALDLLCNILEFGGQTVYDQFKNHMLEFVDLNKLFSVYANLMIKASERLSLYNGIVAKLLNFLRFLYSFEPTMTLRLLQNTSFLPTSSSLAKRTSLAFVQRASKTGIFMQDIIIPFEKAKGVYPITLGYIQLITTVLDQSNETDIYLVYPSIEFTVREIWCHFERWRVNDSTEAIEIAKSLLCLLNSCFKLAKSTLNDCQEWIRTHFVWSGDTGFMDPLLDIITKSYDECQYLYASHRFFKAYKREQLAIEALQFIKNLLVYKDRVNEFSPLEKRILEFTSQEGSQDERETMLILGLNVLYPFDRLIPTLSTQILTMLLKSAMDSRTIFSLLGYFGHHVDALVRGYMDLAMYDSGPDLSVAIYEFWKQVYQSQISLAMVFFHDHENASKSILKTSYLFQSKVKEASKNKPNILLCLVHHLKQCDELAENKPKLLFSVMDFICSLWHRPTETKHFLARIKKEPAFWDVLIKLIPCEVEMPGNVIQHSVQWTDEKSGDLSIEHADVQICSYLLLSKCAAMRIISLDLFMLSQQQPRKANMSNGSWSTNDLKLDDLNDHQKKAMRLVSSQLESWFARDTKLLFDVTWYREVKQQVSEFFNAKCKLSDFRFQFGTDVDRSYGDFYFYNLNLMMDIASKSSFKSKLKHLKDKSACLKSNSITTEHNLAFDLESIKRNICSLNHLWSITDAQLIAIRSWSFCLQSIVSCCPLDVLWSSEPKEKCFKFIAELIEMIVEQKQSMYPYPIYTRELSVLLHFFVKEFVKIGPSLQQLVNLFELMVSLLQSSTFPVVETVEMKDEMHEYWAGIILNILNELFKGKHGHELEKFKGNLSQSFTQLMSVVSTGLSGLLKWRLSLADDELMSDETKTSSTSSGTMVKLSVFIHLFKSSVMFMNLNSLSLAHLLRCIQKDDLLSDLLTIYSLLMQRYTNASVSKVQPDKLLLEVIECFTVLTNVQSISASLIQQGVMTVFLNTDMVPSLSEGLVDPYMGNEVNEWHEAWCGTLQVIQQLLLNGMSTSSSADSRIQRMNREGRSEMLTSYSHVLNIMSQQFWRQVERVLDMSSEPCLSLRRLREMAAIVRLFWCFAGERIEMKNEWLNQTQVIGYQSLICRVIKYFVFLINHPKLLSARMNAISKYEREMKSNQVEDGSEKINLKKDEKAGGFQQGLEQHQPTSQFTVSAKRIMTDILCVCAHHLRVSTGAEQILDLICSKSVFGLYGQSSEMHSYGVFNSIRFVSLFSQESWFQVEDLIDLATILYEDEIQKGRKVKQDKDKIIHTTHGTDEVDPFIQNDDGAVESVLLVILNEYLHSRDQNLKDDLISFIQSHSQNPSLNIFHQALLYKLIS